MLAEGAHGAVHEAPGDVLMETGSHDGHAEAGAVQAALHLCGRGFRGRGRVGGRVRGGAAPSLGEAAALGRGISRLGVYSVDPPARRLLVGEVQ